MLIELKKAKWPLTNDLARHINLHQRRYFQPKNPAIPSVAAVTAPMFSIADLTLGSSQSPTIFWNLSGSFPRGYFVSGMGSSRNGQICSQPRPSSNLTTRSLSLGSASFTFRILHSQG